MKCNSSQCDQYFTKCVKFTHSSTYSFLKTSIFISLLGKKPLYQVLSRKYDKLFWTRGKSLNLEDELEVGGSLWWRGIMSQEGEWKAGHVVGPRQSGLPVGAESLERKTWLGCQNVHILLGKTVSSDCFWKQTRLIPRFLSTSGARLTGEGAGWCWERAVGETRTSDYSFASTSSLRTIRNTLSGGPHSPHFWEEKTRLRG